MTDLLIVDDSALVTEHVAARVVRELGWGVRIAADPDQAASVVAGLGEPDLALVDLSFPPPLSGLDALLAIHRRDPATGLVVYTQGDGPATDVLRHAWHAFPLAAAISKALSVARLLSVLRAVERREQVWVDPVLRPHLPRERSPWRTPEAFARLVSHAGYAKLWRALIELPDEPSYSEIGRHAGVDPKTVRNYRQELLAELVLHDLDRPTMRHLQVFAKVCRPLLEPHIHRRMTDAAAARNDQRAPSGRGCHSAG